MYFLLKYHYKEDKEMKVYLNKITGIDDAIVSMYFSKRSWNRGMETHIREVTKAILNSDGVYFPWPRDKTKEFDEWMDKLIKIGTKHITLLRFIDFSFTVEGIHRAGQDDWDAHAKRFDNRIIRASTRLATFEGDEMSDWYKGKIMTMDQVLRSIDAEVPEKITDENGTLFVRATNGYIREDLKDDKDAKRGLYMECIPSNFIFKVNLTEWAHVYKMRNKSTNANPEVKQLCENIADLLEDANPWFTRDLFNKIEN